MDEIVFEYLLKEEFPLYASRLFFILHSNMSLIAPTGNNYEEDFKFWREAFGRSFVDCDARRLILIRRSGGEVIGYFCYSVDSAVFRMEEIQLMREFHGRYGIFRRLYGFVVANLPNGLEFVEAYANKGNSKSIAVLGHLGLEIVGNNKSGKSYHFCGKMSDLTTWLRGNPE